MLANAPIYAYVPVHDLQRARRFYEDKLGLPPGQPIGPGLSYSCGEGTAFFMYPTPGAGTNKASCAFWKVGDIEAVVAALKAKGIVFEDYDMPGMKTVNGIFTGGGARSAWFKDTEGNIMAIVADAA